MLACEQVVLPGDDLRALPLLRLGLGHGESSERRVLGHGEDVLHLAQPGVDALEDGNPVSPGLRLLQGGEDVVQERDLPALARALAHAPAPFIGENVQGGPYFAHGQGRAKEKGLGLSPKTLHFFRIFAPRRGLEPRT
jgi:hypothetical protein